MDAPGRKPPDRRAVKSIQPKAMVHPFRFFRSRRTIRSMFGHDDVETTATVVAITEKGSSEVNGKFKFEVVLDVAATDGPAFRVTTEHRFHTLFSPDPGDVLKVRYDPKNHKTKIDTDGDPRYDMTAHEQQRRREGDAAVAAAMAQPAGTAPHPFQGAQQDPELAELVAEERRQMATAQSPVPPTVAPGPATPVVSSASFALPTPGATPVPAVAPPAAGEPGRLQHLQMLRDGGLLTPEEFETLRTHLQSGS